MDFFVCIVAAVSICVVTGVSVVTIRRVARGVPRPNSDFHLYR